MEVVDVEQILKTKEYMKRRFLGTEDIITRNIIWKIFSMIKKLSPSFVQFYKLPYEELHGVMTRFEM